MEADEHKVAALYGPQADLDRDRVIDYFCSGKAKVLITTNAFVGVIEVATMLMGLNCDLFWNQNR